MMTFAAPEFATGPHSQKPFPPQARTMSRSSQETICSLISLTSTTSERKLSICHVNFPFVLSLYPIFLFQMPPTNKRGNQQDPIFYEMPYADIPPGVILRSIPSAATQNKCRKQTNAEALCTAFMPSRRINPKHLQFLTVPGKDMHVCCRRGSISCLRVDDVPYQLSRYQPSTYLSCFAALIPRTSAENDVNTRQSLVPFCRPGCTPHGHGETTENQHLIDRAEVSQVVPGEQASDTCALAYRQKIPPKNMIRGPKNPMPSVPACVAAEISTWCCRGWLPSSLLSLIHLRSISQLNGPNSHAATTIASALPALHFDFRYFHSSGGSNSSFPSLPECKDILMGGEKLFSTRAGKCQGVWSDRFP